MVTKFLVTWVVITWSLGACPPPAPVCDDYGRCSESMLTYAGACWDSSEKQMSREFDTRKEAERFVADGRGGSTETIVFGNEATLANFKIEEVKRDK